MDNNKDNNVEKKKTSAGSRMLTVFLVLVVLCLAGAVGWMLFGDRIGQAIPAQLLPSARHEETASGGNGGTASGANGETASNGADGETTGNNGEGDRAAPSGSQTPNFVPIILPEGAGASGDVTPFLQAGQGEEPYLPDETDLSAGNGEAGGNGTGNGDGTGTDTASGGAAPVQNTDPPPSLGPVDYATANAHPAGLTLSTEDFTVTKIGQKTTLKVSGGTGVYAWASQNPAIATVDASGVVTAVASGTTNVAVTDGEKKAVCIVRVKGLSEEFSLNRSDFTRSVAEGDYQLKLSGWTGAVTWTTSNANVATVSADGTVTPVGTGHAVITATFGEHSRQCFVHVTA